MHDFFSSSQSKTERRVVVWIIFASIALLLFTSPLIRGGNRQFALAALVGLSLLLLALCIGLPANLNQEGRGTGVRARLIKMGLGALLTSPAWLAILQLYPWAISDWLEISGRLPYVPALRALGISQPQSLPLSLNPQATVASLVAGLPMVAACLAALVLPRDFIWKLALVLLFGALLQIPFAMLQYFQGADSAAYFDSVFRYRMIGTFNNRNHLADYCGMMIPLWFGLMAAWRQRTKAVNSPRIGFMIPVWYVFGLAVMVVLLATQSRGGLLASSVGLIFSLAIYIRTTDLRLSLRSWLFLILGLVAFGLMAVSSVGAAHVAERFDKQVFEADARLRNQFSLSTLEAARQFWPWGSGAGTYESVFPRFQHVESVGYISFAHNDYVQLLMEFGAAGLGLAVLFLVLAVGQAVQLISFRLKRRGPWADWEAQQWFAGVSVLVLLLHSWVEFNTHIPALAITASFLFGVFMRQPEAAASRAE